MTIWELARVCNAVLFAVVCVLFGVVNWMRRQDTERWDLMARIGSWAYWLCACYATTDAIWNDVPTGPRQMPILACLLLITVSYLMLLLKRRKTDDGTAAHR
jgi:hypothetical protein